MGVKKLKKIEEIDEYEARMKKLIFTLVKLMIFVKLVGLLLITGLVLYARWLISMVA